MWFRFALLFCVAGALQVPHKRYKCDQQIGACASLAFEDAAAGAGTSHSVCSLTCGKGNLWPMPREASIQNSVAAIRAELTFDYSHADCPALETAVTHFNAALDTLRAGLTGSERRIAENDKLAEVQVVFDVAEKCGQEAGLLKLHHDESYSLSIQKSEKNGENKIFAKIKAQNFYGTRHGLETLKQLIVLDEIEDALYVANAVEITDSPAFTYRGLVIDTSRHFLPVTTIKTIIKGLSMNKMNSLHLHLSDTASFPVQLTKQPKITQTGAYGPKMVYSKKDIADLLAYAKTNGVRLIPEIDAPAHANMGWKWGAKAGLGDLVLCTEGWANKALEPPSGQMNVVNDNLYEVLGDIYSDVVALFGDSSGLYHLGGDEVVVGSDKTWAACWNSTTAGAQIIAYLKKNKMPRDSEESFYKLWQMFQLRATQKLEEAYKNNSKTLDKIIQWGGAGHTNIVYNLIDRDDVTDHLDPKKFIIEVWDEVKGSITPTLIKKGYEVILAHSDYVYLDCGSSGWAHPGGFWCNPYHEWYKMYQYIPDIVKEWNLTPQDLTKVLGAETAMWTEEVDAHNIEQKVFPRTAALGERLWSNPSTGWFEADTRFQQNRERMVQAGINAEALQTQWCLYNPGKCTLNTGTPVEGQVEPSKVWHKRHSVWHEGRH